jgi:hypothetical protein
LNNLEVDDPSALNTNNVENVRRSVSLMIPAVVGIAGSWLLHLLVIFRGDLPGERDDSRDDQDLSGPNCHRGEPDQRSI